MTDVSVKSLAELGSLRRPADEGVGTPSPEYMSVPLLLEEHSSPFTFLLSQLRPWEREGEMR